MIALHCASQQLLPYMAASLLSVGYHGAARRGAYVTNLLRSLRGPTGLVVLTQLLQEMLGGTLGGEPRSSLQNTFQMSHMPQRVPPQRRKQPADQLLSARNSGEVQQNKDDHKGHKFCSLEEAYERERESFEELLRGVESWQSAETLSCLETLQTSKKKALQSVTKDAEKVTDYFDKLISALECKKSEILSDFETLKLVVMQAYDPEITRLSAALEEQRRALSIAESFRSVSDPLCFLQQMQEFREKLRVLKETSLPPRKEMDVGPLVRNFDVKKWDSLRLREVDKIAVPHESGSYRVGGSRMAAPRWITLFMSLLLPTLLLLLLQPHYLAAYVTPQIEPFVTTVSSHLAHTGVYLREMTDFCTSLMGAGQECVVNLIDSAVSFIGSCFESLPHVHRWVQTYRLSFIYLKDVRMIISIFCCPKSPLHSENRPRQHCINSTEAIVEQLFYLVHPYELLKHVQRKFTRKHARTCHLHCSAFLTHSYNICSPYNGHKEVT
ncbi:E3 ubiquitin-protein ligase TRIM13 isoform X1 [Lates japonicus]|uniref:E3 ubiquitin-protein ligase TRIM13 isoform X1 n=1 Tax=Lates japonicus TaxID=270547 RepID=A0AAD3R1V0_LATJO|nr:E3 ubiquitin-protein ligase TRIM13 isoform X1 [Lates japonicus]